MSDFIHKVANFAAWAAKNDAGLAGLYLALIYMAANWIIGLIEKVIWGETFLHVGDIVIAAVFLGFYFVVIYHCAINNYAGAQ